MQTAYNIGTNKSTTHPAKREKGNTMINISTKTINPAARYRVTMTDPIDGSTEERIMIGADLKQTAYAIGHLYDINVELIPDTKQGTQTTGTAEQTEQDVETTPAAEPETETAETIETTETAQDAERDARIADIIDAIRREKAASAYRTKQRTTAKDIRERARLGVPTVYAGYCDAQYMLMGITPDYYTAGVYGWNYDVYSIAGLTICTGYRGMVGKRAIGTSEHEQRARAAAGSDERDAILAEWIADNLDAIQAAREGARA